MIDLLVRNRELSCEWQLRLIAAEVITGYIPDQIWSSMVISIPSSGRDDYSIPKAFRPISLFKVLERMILNELEVKGYVVSLSKSQYAFRKRYICDSALSDMVNNIDKSMYWNEYAVGFFFGITGAFDNLSLPSADKRHEADPHSQAYSLLV